MITKRIDRAQFEALKLSFHHLSSQSDAGPAGTMVMDSGVPGPTVGITVMTHGNEPAGLAAWQSLARTRPLELVKGRVIWVLNNLEAAENYFALPFETPFAEKMRTRLLDRNMNRLPRDLSEHDPAEAYEIQRSLELLPVWRSFDIGLDIHTTSQSAPPMLCIDDTIDPELYRGFPIEDVIIGFDAVTRDASVLNYFGNDPGRIGGFSIEAGGHEDAASWAMAETAVRILLANLGMIAPVETQPRLRRVYHLTSGVFFPSANYSMTKIFPNFAPVNAGEVIATGEGPDLIAPHDGHVLMCPKTGRLSDIREEAVFLSAPMQELMGE